MSDSRDPGPVSDHFVITGKPATYEEWVSTLEPCPSCGHVDVMDNIEGRLLCAACYLDELSDDEDDDWWGEDDELAS
jgi:hypothetical protein